MNGVTYRTYVPGNENHEVTGQLVECYRDVFSQGPWHEWLKCGVCGKYWGRKDTDELVGLQYRHCGRPLQDFWPRDVVVGDIYHEITQQAHCLLAMVGDEVIGFCWAYLISVGALEEKLGITFDDLHGSECIVYLDEVGMQAKYRNLKIAKEMLRNLKQYYLKQGVTKCLARTRALPEPSVLFLWHTKKLGYEIIASYPKSDGRVVLARTLDVSLLQMLS